MKPSKLFLLSLFNSEKIFMTGVGKNKRVAQLLCDSFQSIGYPVVFVDVTDMLHGSLGLVRSCKSKPAIIYLSKTGLTDEVLLAAKYTKDVAFNILVTMNNQIKSDDRFDLIQYIEHTDEVDPLNKLPSYSLIKFQEFFFAIIKSMFDDGLVTDEIFLSNHPLGGLHKGKI